MFDNINPEEHKDHDPARCDFARIYLTQRYVQGEDIIPVLDTLTVEQVITIGFTSAYFSEVSEAVSVYESHGITMEQLFAFSEVLRHYLMNTRVNSQGMKFVANTDNVSLN
jgi:hypothetical protein